MENFEIIDGHNMRGKIIGVLMGLTSTTEKYILKCVLLYYMLVLLVFVGFASLLSF
jgi:hypothetical protein